MTGCADCVPQWIVINDSNANGAKMYVNVSSFDECRERCTKDLSCVAIDIDHKENPLRCWPHFDVGDIRHDNIYDQQGTSLHIPVKRCIASLYCKLSYYIAICSPCSCPTPFVSCCWTMMPHLAVDCCFLRSIACDDAVLTAYPQNSEQRPK